MIGRWAIVVLACGSLSAQEKAAEAIRLHPENPHYFLFHGKAVALVGSGEHYGAVFNGEFDYHKYLATIAAEGMNYTRLFGGSYVEVPEKSFGIKRNDLAPAAGRFVAPWARRDVAGYAGGGNKFDLTKWNPEYFSRLHDFLTEADRRGIVVELTLFSSQYGEAQWELSPFKPENNVNATDAIDWKKLNTAENGNILAFQEQYARKLVREAGVHGNVIFEIANEPWSDRPVLTDVINPYLFTGRDQYPNSVDLPDAATMEWQKRVAEWITSEETTVGRKHLIAQDCCNFRYAMKGVLPGASVVNFHYAYPEAASLNWGLGKAISYDETGFLGRSDEAYARQAWNFMLSGGGVFDSLDYSFSVGHEDGTDGEPNGPGGGGAELRRRLRILSEFLNGLPLVEMRPDFETVVHAGGAVTHAMVAGKSPRPAKAAGNGVPSASGAVYAMYVDGNGPTEITLRLDAGEYELSWVDVVSGTVNRPEKFMHPGGEKTVITPAFRGGIAMRLRMGSK